MQKEQKLLKKHLSQWIGFYEQEKMQALRDNNKYKDKTIKEMNELIKEIEELIEYFC